MCQCEAANAIKQSQNQILKKVINRADQVLKDKYFNYQQIPSIKVIS